MGNLPFAATTPVSVGRVGLRARDADRLAGFYRQVLGLAETGRSNGAIGLGAGGRTLLEIEDAPGLKPDDKRHAGLYHTAFLLPSRADLARWVEHASASGVRITGASDHSVSEAIYLDDPEGNGIEIYADRPPESWSFTQDGVVMATERLNFENLMSELPEGDAGWAGAPDGTVVGHVHLRVGDTAKAEEWWRNEMGFDTTRHRGDQAVFLSTGGYHHHIGANTWQSAGAGARAEDRAGLAFVELLSKDGAERTVADPWGTEIRLRPA